MALRDSFQFANSWHYVTPNQVEPCTIDREVISLDNLHNRCSRPHLGMVAGVACNSAAAIGPRHVHQGCLGAFKHDTCTAATELRPSCDCVGLCAVSLRRPPWVSTLRMSRDAAAPVTGYQFWPPLATAPPTANCESICLGTRNSNPATLADGSSIGHGARDGHSSLLVPEALQLTARTATRRIAQHRTAPSITTSTC